MISHLTIIEVPNLDGAVVRASDESRLFLDETGGGDFNALQAVSRRRVGVDELNRFLTW